MILLRLIDRGLLRLVSALAQILLALSVCAAFYQVIARFVLQSPADWTEVLTRALLIWTVMLGIVLAFRSGAMISVELMRTVLGPRWGRWLENFSSLLCIGFLLFLARVGWQMTWRVRFQTMPSLDISISWIYVAIPVGTTLAAIAILARWLAGPDEPVDARNDAAG